MRSPYMIAGLVLLVLGIILLGIGIIYAVIYTEPLTRIPRPPTGQIILPGATIVDQVPVAIPYAVQPNTLTAVGFTISIPYPNGLDPTTLRYIFLNTLFPCINVEYATTTSQSIVWYSYTTSLLTFYFPTDILDQNRTFIAINGTTSGDIISVTEPYA